MTKEHFSATAIVWQDQMRKKEEFHHGLLARQRGLFSFVKWDTTPGSGKIDAPVEQLLFAAAVMRDSGFAIANLRTFDLRGGSFQQSAGGGGLEQCGLERRGGGAAHLLQRQLFLCDGRPDMSSPDTSPIDVGEPGDACSRAGVVRRNRALASSRWLMAVRIRWRCTAV